MSEQLDQLLKAAGLKPRPAYRPGDVQKILVISPRTFSTMVTTFEKDEHGRPRKPNTLASYMLGRERRVTYEELEAFLIRNETWERLNASPEIQLKIDFYGY